MTEAIRPTKKQKELLGFIEAFIKEHGYSPSYREIMNGLGYTSVATVALHVNSLIKRGHLRKRDRSARSLEVVGINIPTTSASAEVLAGEEKWLVDKVNAHITQIEGEAKPSLKSIDDIYVLIGALHVIGLDDAVRSFIPRLSDIKQKLLK